MDTRWKHELRFMIFLYFNTFVISIVIQFLGICTLYIFQSAKIHQIVLNGLLIKINIVLESIS